MSTEFGPGKYRMANGEQAIVVCDVGENPIGPNDPYPLKGYTKKGCCSWTRCGTEYGPDAGSDEDLREPWTDPPTTLEVCEELRRLWPEAPEAYNGSSSMSKVLKMADAAIAAEKARTAC